jgi:hypothetical protein
MINSQQFHYFMIMLLLIVFTMPAHAFEHEAGEVVIRHGVVDDDLYLAGTQIELYADVTGDAIVAGGQLNLEGNTGDDVLAAGGTIGLRGSVGDDARLAAGALALANTGLHKMGKTDVSKSMHVFSLAVVIFLFAVINLLPLVGSLISGAVLLAGLGALSRQLYLGTNRVRE